ncbi:MAG: hypothetical protein M1831_005051 [Alyxoria varia]|nr:MAG: hypothetical protein M1831_005051 [Alyxoria varia]
MPTARSLPGDLTWNLSSPNCCTNDAVHTIRTLLFDEKPFENVALRTSAVTSRQPPSKAGVSKKAGQVTGRARKVQKAPEIHKDARKVLSDQQKSKVATEIVNLVLETLSTAGSNKDASQGSQIHASDLKVRVSTHGPTTGRFFQQAPERVCLQEQSPNKRRTGAKDEKVEAQHSETTTTGGLSALADCGGLAFRYLQSHNRVSQKQNQNGFPSYQLEKGILVFIERLLGLGLTKKALAETRFLKSCLRFLISECAASSTLEDEKLPSSAPAASDESNLLFIYGHETLTPALAKIVFDFQTMAVRMASSLTDSSHLVNMLPYLDTSHPRSPIKCLVHCTSDQMATQLKAFSQLLWQIASRLPVSHSSSADAPGCISLQLRTFALQTRVQLMKACDCQINIASDVLSPFHKCLMNFADQSKKTPVARYRISRAMFDTLLQSLQETYNRSFSNEYIELQLGRLATEASLVEESSYHAEEVLTKDSNFLTSAKKCALTVRIAHGRLVEASRWKKNVSKARDALSEAATLIEAEVLGDSADLEDMLRSILDLRKAILQLLNSSETNLGLDLKYAMHLFLCFSIKVLCQLFCFPSARNAFKSYRDLLKNKRALMVHVAKPIIESTLFSLKQQQVSKTLEWDHLSSVLQDCSLVLDTISSEMYRSDVTPLLAPAESTSYRLRISDFYWFFAIQRDNLPQQCSESQMTSLRKACECVKLMDISSKLRAMLPLKMYRLSTFLQESSNVEEAATTLFDLVKFATEAGVLSEENVKLSSMPVIHSSNKDDHDLWRITSKALRKLLELKWEHQKQHGTETLFYDDERLSAEQRGYLLECQLIMLLDIPKDASVVSAERTRRAISQRLLDLYDQEHFPIRRCRAIILLLYSSSMSEQDTPKDWLLESAKMAIDQNISDSRLLARDSHLASCQSTWLTLLKLCLSVHSRSHFMESLHAASLVWSANEIPKSLDDEAKTLSIEVEIWISQLELAADCSNMLGLEKQRLSALLVLYRVRSKVNIQTTQGIADYALRISQQSLRLGHISMAKTFMHKARHWAGGKAVLMGWKIRMALVEFQSSMAVGDDKNRHGSDEKSLSKFVRRHCEDKVDAAVLTADILGAFGNHCLRNGCLKRATVLSKQTISLLQRTWKALESPQGSKAASAQTDNREDIEGAVSGMTQLHLSHAEPEGQQNSKDDLHDSKPGLHFWPLLRSLVDACLFLRTLSKHCGMHQEAIYATEQAEKAVRSLGSQGLLGRILVSKSEITCSSGDSHESWKYLEEANSLYKSADDSMDLVLHHRGRGNFYHRQQQWSTEIEAYAQAEHVLNQISASASKDYPGFEDPVVSINVATASLSINEKQENRVPPKPSGQRKPLRSTKSKPKEGNRTLPSPSKDSAIQIDDFPSLNIVRSDILRRKAENAIAQHQYAEAAVLLLDNVPHYFPIDMIVRLHAALASLRIREGISHMAGDAVFGMLPESTLSYPATSIVTDGQPERLAHDSNGHSKPRKPLSKIQSSSKTDQHPRQTSSMPFVDRLLEALSLAADIHPDALEKCSNFTVYQACAAIGTAAMLLASTRSEVARGRVHSLMIPYTIELSKINATFSEQLFTESNDTIKKELLDDYSIDTSKGAGSVSMSRFQHDFLEEIPQQWNVVSISLTAECTHLYVVRYRAGQAPFILRLPLTRQHADDLEEETFTFGEAMTELLDIIQASDATVHRAKDGTAGMETKSAKTQWWAEREELDDRIKTLLMNIENIWLGGFRGVFSQLSFKPALLARFQQSFINILSKHLPSRQRNQRGQPNPKINVDIRVLELFVGLGDPEEHGHDMEEALTDLFYFVIDILQYNGERNAYDEVDFDAMIVETQDALHSYHEALRHEESWRGPPHTILILDNKLHGFPWESLPCLEKQSISRVSSFVDLRDRIAIMKQQQSTEGIRISRDNGTYFLNPSGDLAKTQTRFEKPLSALTNTESRTRWSHITRRIPSEQEFSNALSMHNSEDQNHHRPDPTVFLYFGHGSGLHYIRSKTIKRLRCRSSTTTDAPTPTPTCATTLLFGCSSASLRTAGEFEPTGTPRTYMLAGAPALLGSLWDVTDGDCDRYASGVLTRWGLLKRGVEEFDVGKNDDDGGKKGKRGVGKRGAGATRTRGGRAKTPARRTREDGDGGEDGGARKQSMCLSEAAANARGDCYLRYLNGAAMVVYGVPCFLG